ncbi:MAG: hypothetical protein KC442_07615 [Thermomicrobiales bacterium]|nr:hypothetical protein [Thermomicrobiales bacterium]
MICRYCKSALAADALVCTQCGAPQPAPAPQAPRSRRRQMEVRVSWGEPAHDLLAHPPAAPLAPPPPPPPYAAPAFYAPQAPWHQQPYWTPTPRMRSFRWQAFFALLLYFPFFLPGLIANIIWWNQARTLESATGIAPRGKGCLTVLLVCGVMMLLFSMGIAGFF